MEGVFYFVPMGNPVSLKPGDKVAVVATAKRLEQSVDKGVSILESWGLTVEQGENLHKHHGYFAGSDEQRLMDVQKALDDPSIKAIIFARGGYGTTRILDQINFSTFKKSPKWLVGFSDLTSILLQSAVFNIPAIHGPACITLGKDALSDQSLHQILFGSAVSKYPLIEHALTSSGSCSGKIVGGNLCLVCESIGASNEIQTEGNILFLEEVGEDKYSIDRMMSKLKRTGKLDSLSGVILGSFSHIKDSKHYFVESIEEIILSYFEDLKIPLALGMEAGHEKRNLPLITGQDATVNIRKQSIEVHYTS